MKPPKNEQSNLDYEKVKTDDFITGIISDVKYDEEHTFKGYQGAEDKVKPAVMIQFTLEGYEYAKYSGWLSFSYDGRSNLFNTYIVPLVSGAEEYMDFDLDNLKGTKVKVLFKDTKSGFQKVDNIRPIGTKVSVIQEISLDEPDELAEPKLSIEDCFNTED